MKGMRDNIKLRSLALAALEDHPDIAELNRVGKELLESPDTAVDFVALAARYTDDSNKRYRDELVCSAREILRLPSDPMSRARTAALGSYILLLGTVLLTALPWAWSTATDVIELGSRPAHLLLWEFTATPAMVLVIVVTIMAMIGSVTVMGLVFSSRAGQRTLQQGYLWWYLTRPITAAGLAILFYVAVVAGFFDVTAIEGGSSTALMIAAALGGLAGLFTDQVLKKMEGVLGLLPFTSGAAGQDATSEVRSSTDPT